MVEKLRTSFDQDFRLEKIWLLPFTSHKGSVEVFHLAKTHTLKQYLYYWETFNIWTPIILFQNALISIFFIKNHVVKYDTSCVHNSQTNYIRQQHVDNYHIVGGTRSREFDKRRLLENVIDFVHSRMLMYGY